jgi:zinc transport system substrate-binding protein
MKKTWLTVVVAGWFATLGVAAQAAEALAPKVVVSIKPLHSLVAGVMEGVGEPQLLIGGGGSPHGYVLRPSEARLLDEAQLVVWIGPGLESFLEKPLSTLGTQARRLALAEALGEELLPQREGGAWDRHGHDHLELSEEPAAHHQNEPEERDLHFWLDPRLAKQIVDRTTSALTGLDPAHRQQYRDNAARLKQRLDDLHARLEAKLAPVRHLPYVVFHDAYQYFEAAYGLNAVGSLTIDPERKPGARRILEIRGKILELKARCVFSEPQFEPRLVATVIEGTGARKGILDPLGAEITAGAEGYFRLLEAMADSLVAGLSP